MPTIVFDCYRCNVETERELTDEQWQTLLGEGDVMAMAFYCDECEDEVTEDETT